MASESKSRSERSGCPCTIPGIEPCSYACTCAKPAMSGGCARCARYGSLEQQQKAARRIVAALSEQQPRTYINGIEDAIEYLRGSTFNVSDGTVVEACLALLNAFRAQGGFSKWPRPFERNSTDG